MKIISTNFFFLLALISINSFAETRVPSIPFSDAEKYVAAKTLEELDFFKHTCISKPDEDCIVAECDPRYSKIEIRFDTDPENGIYNERKVLVCDDEKKLLIQSMELAKENEYKDLQNALRSMDCGRNSQAFLLVRNMRKGLTKQQTKQLVMAYAGIKGLLDTGSLDSAIEEINAVNPDGVVITAEDKTKMVEFINKCKP
jgi:hypothetical protein